MIRLMTDAEILARARQLVHEAETLWKEGSELVNLGHQKQEAAQGKREEATELFQKLWKTEAQRASEK
jgi:hypothetical protein